jgi:amino acid permease
MHVRLERVRVLILALCVVGVVVAAFEPAVGVAIVGGTLALLVLVLLATWLVEPRDRAD